jgi:hypothetical protein
MPSEMADQSGKSDSMIIHAPGEKGEHIEERGGKSHSIVQGSGFKAIPEVSTLNIEL